MQTADYGIEAPYLIIKNYNHVADWSKRRNILYDNYLEVFEKIFTAYRQFYEETQQFAKGKSHEKSIYLQEFKTFLRKFSQIMRDTSIYQIDCITQIRTSRQDTISAISDEIVQKVQGYGKLQHNYRVKVEQLIARHHEMEKQYENLKTQVSSAALFYNSRNMKARLKIISNQLDDISQIQKQLDTNKKHIINNSQEFETYLIRFRKKLLQNKYNMLHRMIEQSHQFRGCLTEILLLLVQCVSTKKQQFQALVKNPKDDTIRMTQSKGRKKGEDIDLVVSNLINSIQEYNSLIDEISDILKAFDFSLKKLNNKVHQILETNKKNFLDNLNNIYAVEESPAKEVTETLDLFEYYTNKIGQISDKLYQSTNKLSMLKQNVRRHADVTLSLIRSNNPKNKQAPQVQQVYNQISYDFITEILSEVLKGFQDTLYQIKSHFHEKCYKKKKMKTEDSMQVSHIDETILPIKKKPCKKQLWLWRDWRDKTSFNTEKASRNNTADIKNFIGVMKMEQESQQIDKFQCVFHGKKDVKGVLKICEKTIQFISLIGTSNVQLIVPYGHIQQLQLKIRMFQKCIVLKTQKGELVFSKFDNIQDSHDKINQRLNKNQKQAGGNVVKKKTVQLLPEQIDFLQKNKGKLQSERPTIQGMMNIQSIFVDNISIDVVYDFIYSDKPFSVMGKQQDAFFTYCMKKAKNFNYITGIYDRPGPEFYSHDNQFNFTNCPLFSTRVNQFDHPMPPIPFMPKHCHCKQICKMYWLSNQYFDYSIVSLSSGAPYADTFEVKLTHRVFKQGTGVKIDIMGGLFFVKETGMKGMLKSKGENQMIEAGKFTAAEIQKVLNIVSGNAKPEQQPKNNQTQGKVQAHTPHHRVSKLEKQKKMLIIAFVVVFLINIIIKLW